MDEEYTVYSQFDMSLHRQSGFNLEIMIAPDGSIRYAVPSHQEFLIDAACASLCVSRETLIKSTPSAYKLDYMRWLIMLCGYMPVWPAYVFAESPTHPQLLALKSLKKSGLYRGPIPLCRRKRLPAPASDAEGGLVHKFFSEAEENRILEILREGEGQEIVCDHGVREAWFHSRDYSAELRVQFQWQYRVTISRVGLKRQRQGIMSRVLEIMRGYCEREGVRELVVQGVLTQPMANWCAKHEFMPIENAAFELNGITMGDYGKIVP